MYDLVERVEIGPMVEDSLSKCRAIECTVLTQDSTSPSRDDRVECRTAWSHSFSRELIGIDDRRSLPFQNFGNDRLSAGDVSGQCNHFGGGAVGSHNPQPRNI